MALWQAAIYGLLIMIPLAFAESILIALGQTAELSAMAAGYLHVAMFGIMPALIAMTMRGFLAAVDHAAVLLWVSILAVMVNALLAYTLIFGNFGAPALGLTGAAAGSVATNIGMAVVLVFYGARKRALRKYAILANFHRPDWRAMAGLLKLGIPIGLTILAEVGMFNGATILMGWQ